MTRGFLRTDADTPGRVKTSQHRMTCSGKSSRPLFEWHALLVHAAANSSLFLLTLRGAISRFRLWNRFLSDNLIGVLEPGMFTDFGALTYL